jgi:DNA-binding LacI/PurR family transcriptional regulator
MGKEAVKLITEKIGNKSKKHNNIIVKEKLVLRESSGSRRNK